MTTGHAKATCFEWVFKEQTRQLHKREQIRQLKSMKILWMSRLYWPLVIVFLGSSQLLTWCQLKQAKVMASLVLTRTIYLQEGKASPATDLYPASPLTSNLTALTLSFSKENCYATLHFHSSIRWGLFSSAWDTALHSKRELLLQHKALFWLLRAPTGAGCWQLWDNPLH